MDQNKRVADFLVKGEGWNWMALDHVLPVEVKLNLSAFILIEKDDVIDGVCIGLFQSQEHSQSSMHMIVSFSLWKTMILGYGRRFGSWIFLRGQELSYGSQVMRNLCITYNVLGEAF